MRKVILITAIGSFSADIVIKNLKKNDYKIIGCDIYPKEWLVDSHNVNEFYQVPLSSNENEYIEAILNICTKEKVELICPLTDVEIDVLTKNRHIFEDKGIILTISSDSTIRLCRNKEDTAQYLMGIEGLHLIKIYNKECLDKGKIQFPVVCKRVNGRSSQGLHYFYKESELIEFAKENDMESYIVQPFISGNILTVDVVRSERDKQGVAVVRRELLRTPNGAGTSVYVFNDNELENLCLKIAEVLNINGCVNFEFIENGDGIRYFLECNPRFSGGVEFSCIAGYDFISNHIRCFIGEKIDLTKNVLNQYISRKYEEYVTALK